jgi:ABC-type uncharacterized transport system permease subunit
MTALIIALATAAAYLFAAGHQLYYAPKHHGASSLLALSSGAAAILMHGYLVFDALQSHALVPLGFIEASSLAFLLTNIAAALLLVIRPLQTILIGLFPLSALVVLAGALAPSDMQTSSLAPGVVIHIACSLSANALLAIAAMQAGLVSLQDQQLRTHHNLGITRWLPPLQKMERLLFELLWIGFAVLSLAIISGFVFLEDMLAQHVAHKTVFTISAWLVYASLLWGHYRQGWRSKTAVKLTLAGFFLILLAYFGSKFVLQWLLG